MKLVYEEYIIIKPYVFNFVYILIFKKIKYKKLKDIIKLILFLLNNYAI